LTIVLKDKVDFSDNNAVADRVDDVGLQCIEVVIWSINQIPPRLEGGIVTTCVAKSSTSFGWGKGGNVIFAV